MVGEEKGSLLFAMTPRFGGGGGGIMLDYLVYLEAGKDEQELLDI